MKISARASGGFAGRSEEVELDTGCHADGAAIEALLERLDFFGAAEAPARPVGADLRRWEITADDGQRCRTVVLAEDALPAGSAASGAGWQALIAHLRGHA
jgi:hypothetical protein